MFDKFVYDFNDSDEDWELSDSESEELIELYSGGRVHRDVNDEEDNSESEDDGEDYTGFDGIVLYLTPIGDKGVNSCDINKTSAKEVDKEVDKCTEDMIRFIGQQDQWFTNKRLNRLNEREDWVSFRAPELTAQLSTSERLNKNYLNGRRRELNSFRNRFFERRSAIPSAPINGMHRNASERPVPPLLYEGLERPANRREYIDDFDYHKYMAFSDDSDN